MNGTGMDFYTEDAQRINAWKFYLSQEHQLGRGWGLNYGTVYTTSVDNSFQRYSGNEELPSDMLSRRRERTLNVYAGFAKTCR